MILILAALIGFSLVAALHFDIQTSSPIVERDGDKWVIRVGGSFVNFYFLKLFSPSNRLILCSGTDDTLYQDCLIPDKALALSYVNHVKDFYSRGRYLYA